MLKNILNLSCLSLLCTLSLFADVDTNAVLKDKGFVDQEGVSIPVPNDDLKNWKVAFVEFKQGKPTVVEWIPASDSIDKWTQLIQYQYFNFASNGLHPFNAEDFTKNFFKILKEQFPTVETKTLENSKDSVLLEWSLPKETAGEKPQSEVARIISTPLGLHRIAYTKNGATMDSKVKEEWLKRLKAVKVVPGTPAGVSSAVDSKADKEDKKAKDAKEEDEEEDEEEDDEDDKKSHKKKKSSKDEDEEEEDSE